MKIMLYSVYDSKAAVYGQPNFLLNRGTALRAWQDACNDAQSNVGKHPADFTMFEIGSWDDETGQITMHAAPISLGNALEFQRQFQTPDPMFLDKRQTLQPTEVNQ